MIIETGDILLFKGDTPLISPAIRWFTNSEYTHVGMAIFPDWVFEIDIRKNLALYPIGNRNYDVFRYKEGLTFDQKETLKLKAIQKVRSHQEHHYGCDYLHIIMFMIEKFIKLPFIIHELNDIICSEIIDEMYGELNIDLVPYRPEGHVAPSHLANAPHLIKQSK